MLNSIINCYKHVLPLLTCKKLKIKTINYKGTTNSITGTTSGLTNDHYGITSGLTDTTNGRSIHPKLFTKFTGIHLCRSPLFNKVAGLRPQACNFIKKKILAQVFSNEFCEIFKNSFFIEHLWWLLSEWTKKYYEWTEEYYG